MRRAWSIPLTVTGGLLLGALLISPSRGRSAGFMQRDEQWLVDAFGSPAGDEAVSHPTAA
jgi:hypothetical protein